VAGADDDRRILQGGEGIGQELGVDARDIAADQHCFTGTGSKGVAKGGLHAHAEVAVGLRHIGQFSQPGDHFFLVAAAIMDNGLDTVFFCQGTGLQSNSFGQRLLQLGGAVRPEGWDQAGFAPTGLGVAGKEE